MKYKIKILVMGLALTFAAPAPSADGAIVIAIAKIIKEAVKKVIVAVDLMIQRLQNKTIWLQNAQKVLENKLNELKLTEIAEWTEKHRKLYKEYYEELWRVRNAIATIQRIKQIVGRQVQLVDEYTRTWELIKQDDHFTKAELEYMYRVYAGILEESVQNLEQILLVINSFKTQMTDAKRLEIIEKSGNEIERNYYDLKEFNTQNIQLSISRAKDEREIQSVKRLYGLPTE
jgi:hypothetical protein